MEDLSLHVLDVAENALAPGATRIEIRVLEDHRENMLRIEIQDNGRGMDQQAARLALDPFFTTKRAKRVGLGLPLLAQAAREAGGKLEIETAPGKGTLVRASFRLSHPDLRPMGDMLQTMAALVGAHPRVQFVFCHRQNGAVVSQWSSNPANAART